MYVLGREMSNPTALSALASEFMEIDPMMQEARKNPPRKARAAKKKSVSDDDATPSSRNELSEILSKLRFTKPPLSESATPTSGTRDPTEIREANRLLSQLQKHTEQVSLNTLLYVKYLTSPLRLYLKTMLQMMPYDDRVAHVATIKVNDRVKNDLIGDWDHKDTFGLKLLVKMYRMYQNVMPMFRNHEDFMKYLKPNHGEDAASRAHITFYLYNYVMNPGYGVHPNGQVSLEHDLHAYYDSFLVEEAEEIAAVGFDTKDFKDMLRNKVAFELNLYASVVFKKSTQFKYRDMNGRMVEEKLNPEQLIHTLFEKFASFPGADVFAQQMTTWMTTDEDMSAPRRGYNGGKRKLKKKH